MDQVFEAGKGSQMNTIVSEHRVRETGHQTEVGRSIGGNHLREGDEHLRQALPIPGRNGPVRDITTLITERKA